MQSFDIHSYDEPIRRYDLDRHVSMQNRVEKTFMSVWDIFRSCDAVCFDVDSTIVQHEGIDMLANYFGVGESVAEWTTRAMNGGVAFEIALQERLEIIKPTLAGVNKLIASDALKLTDGSDVLIKKLLELGKKVFLISGGFIQMIEPIASKLNIPRENIIANVILFDSNGNFAGFDKEVPTSRSKGKAQALQQLIDKFNFRSIAMIGDGVTDLEARPPAAIFIGYGGVVIRERVKKEADLFVTSFASLIESL